MSSIFFTVLQICWAVWWLRLHMIIRKDRDYARDRQRTSNDLLYRGISPFLYLMQNGICVASFWCDAPLLLKFHDSNGWRIAGFVLLISGSIVYSWALRHLGTNYSPCYDAHIPMTLVRSGPYQWIRHPMYAAKLLIAVATIVVSGSLWFVPAMGYFIWATLSSMVREDRDLRANLPDYLEYCSKTCLFVPRIFHQCSDTHLL